MPSPIQLIHVHVQKPELFVSVVQSTVLYPHWVHWFSTVTPSMCSTVCAAEFKRRMPVSVTDAAPSNRFLYLVDNSSVIVQSAFFFSFCVSETNWTFINLVLKLALGQEHKSRKHDGNVTFLKNCQHICIVYHSVMWLDSNHGATIWRLSVIGNGFTWCVHNLTDEVRISCWL